MGIKQHSYSEKLPGIYLCTGIDSDQLWSGSSRTPNGCGQSASSSGGLEPGWAGGVAGSGNKSQPCFTLENNLCSCHSITCQ